VAKFMYECLDCFTLIWSLFGDWGLARPNVDTFSSGLRGVSDESVTAADKGTSLYAHGPGGSVHVPPWRGQRVICNVCAMEGGPSWPAEYRGSECVAGGAWPSCRALAQQRKIRAPQ
jgi:hypothetical protein